MIYRNKCDVIKLINEKQIKKNDLVFSSMKFCEFNEDKCDGLYVHHDKKISMIFGIKNNAILAPFSAPFGFIRYASDYVKYSHVLNFFKSLKESVDNHDSINEIKIVLPPYFYNESMVTKISLALSELRFTLKYRDINSHIDLDKFSLDALPSSTKKAIRLSNSYSNDFRIAEKMEDKILAYNVIKENREMKGYPLRMSLEQVIATTKDIVKAHFFIATVEGEPAAAAIVFEISDTTAQVVYWGANEVGEKCNVMYFLPMEIIKYFKGLEKKNLDIGPSSEFGIISNGLNDYKQMIGCENSNKETWVYSK